MNQNIDCTHFQIKQSYLNFCKLSKLYQDIISNFQGADRLCQKLPYTEPQAIWPERIEPMIEEGSHGVSDAVHHNIFMMSRLRPKISGCLKSSESADQQQDLLSIPEGNASLGRLLKNSFVHFHHAVALQSGILVVSHSMNLSATIQHCLAIIKSAYYDTSKSCFVSETCQQTNPGKIFWF